MDTKEYKRQYYLKNKQKLNKAGSDRYYASKTKLEDRACAHCCAVFSPKRKDNTFCTYSCGVKFWRQNNKESQSEYFKNLYHSNFDRRMSTCLRSRLLKALKGGIKSHKTKELLGCSIEELRVYLESKFQPGMSWNNWTKDGWHIDHIKPLASFDLTDPQQLKEACHYTNLQPLWAEENLRKGDKCE